MNFETASVYPGPDPDFDSMSSAEILSFISETDSHISFAKDHGADELFIIGLSDQRKRAQAELTRRNGKTSTGSETVELLLSPDALHGLPGEIVRIIEPYSEADLVAL